MPKSNDHEAQQLIRRMISLVGDDPTRPDLLETPARVVRSWSELFKGYSEDPLSHVKVFECRKDYDDIVLLANIELYSMCEHHIVPFFGRAHVAYLPHGCVIGASKLARLVEVYSRRLQTQERIGDQLTDFLLENISGCQGTACIIEATHLCMRMRGVSKQNSTMITSSMKGAFRDNQDTRMELLHLIEMRTRKL